MVKLVWHNLEKCLAFIFEFLYILRSFGRAAIIRLGTVEKSAIKRPSKTMFPRDRQADTQRESTGLLLC